MKTFTYHGRKLTISAETYKNNGTLALMFSYEDNCETEVITVNLNSRFQSHSMAFLDTNHAPDIENWIRTNGIGQPMGITVRSGFHVYPLYQINVDAL